MEYTPELEELQEEFTIENIHYYDLSFVDNNLVFKLKPYKTTEEPETLTNSQIIESYVYDERESEVISSGKKKFCSILLDIWEKMPTQKIIQNTTLNIKLGDEEKRNGYIYSDKVKFSFQRKSADGTWKEILKMLELNGYKCEMKIKLENGLLYEYKI